MMCPRQGRREAAAGSLVNIPRPECSLRKDGPRRIGIGPGKMSDQQARTPVEEKDLFQVGQKVGIS